MYLQRAKDFEVSRVRHQVQYLGLLENVRVRRAGFCYRGAFARFVKRYVPFFFSPHPFPSPSPLYSSLSYLCICRYKKLSPKTWGLWGEWTGDMREGSMIIINEVKLANDQYQMGATKVFIRHPETVSPSPLLSVLPRSFCFPPSSLI